MFAAMAVLVGIGYASPVAEGAIPTAPPPRKRYVPPIRRPWNYKGEVLAVTQKSITIRGKQDGFEEDEVTRFFKASSQLAMGQQDPFEATDSDYRLSDVKVGDKVYILLREDGDDDLCIRVAIQRRPKGLVPPAPFEPASTPNKYHEGMNALQAHEERGVPLPPQLDENYQRFLNDRYAHERMLRIKQEDRTAPPPRPVIRK